MYAGMHPTCRVGRRTIRAYHDDTCAAASYLPAHGWQDRSRFLVALLHTRYTIIKPERLRRQAPSAVGQRSTFQQTMLLARGPHPGCMAVVQQQPGV